MASSSFFGSIIAISYLPVAIVPNMETIAINKANTPKFSGVYILVRMGVIAIGIACAIVVPVIRVSILRANSDFGLSLFNIISQQTKDSIDFLCYIRGSLYTLNGFTLPFREVRTDVFIQCFFCICVCFGREFLSIFISTTDTDDHTSTYCVVGDAINYDETTS